MVETDETVNLYRWGSHNVAIQFPEHHNEEDREDEVPYDFEWSAQSGDEYVRRFGCKKRQPVPTVTSFSNVGRAPFKRKGETRFPRLIKRPRRMQCDAHGNTSRRDGRCESG